MFYKVQLQGVAQGVITRCFTRCNYKVFHKVLCKDASRSDLPLDLSKNLPPDLSKNLPPDLSKNLPPDLARHLAKQLSQNLNNVLLALHNENRNLERHRLSVLLHRETTFRASNSEDREDGGD